MAIAENGEGSGDGDPEKANPPLPASIFNQHLLRYLYPQKARKFNAHIFSSIGVL
jgi:hypothetical protein